MTRHCRNLRKMQHFVKNIHKNMHHLTNDIIFHHFFLELSIVYPLLRMNKFPKPRDFFEGIISLRNRMEII